MCKNQDLMGLFVYLFFIEKRVFRKVSCLYDLWSDMFDYTIINVRNNIIKLTWHLIKNLIYYRDKSEKD